MPRPFVEKEFWVDMMATEPRGVLYVGMISDLVGAQIDAGDPG